MYVVPYDLETLEFLVADSQTVHPRRPNPYPRLRMAPSHSLPVASRPAAPDDATARTWPLYAVHVPLERMDTAERFWRQRTHGLRILVPRDPQTHQPLHPGYIYVAIPPQRIESIRALVQWWMSQGRSAGWIHPDPVAAHERDAIWATVTRDPASSSLSDLSPTHPLIQWAAAVAWNRGWTGTWTHGAWSKATAHGTPTTDTVWDAWWHEWCQAWAHGADITAILRTAASRLIQMSFPVVLPPAAQQDPARDWPITWYTLPATLPAKARQGVTVRTGRRKIWATLVQADPLTFSLTDPALPQALVAPRLPVVAWCRDPGHATVVLIDGPVSPTVHGLIETAARQCGLDESWSAVSVHDPIGIVRRLLRPQRWHRVAPAIHVWGVPKARRCWVDTAIAWSQHTIIVH